MHCHCRITLLRLKPYMFEPDDDEETGLRVKQPLASFLGKFKRQVSFRQAWPA